MDTGTSLTRVFSITHVNICYWFIHFTSSLHFDSFGYARIWIHGTPFVYITGVAEI
jgi:hypothetical protein